jgi:hypothetical protein
MRHFDSVGRWLMQGLSDGWLWLASLNQEEWFLLLGLTAGAGFLCMRGFGSRSNY